MEQGAVEMPTGKIRDTDAAGNTVYQIPDYNLDALRARVDKMTRRALRLGMEALVLTVTGEAFKTFTENKIDEDTGRWRKVERTVRFVLVTLVGACPRINGWALAAVIQHEDGGNLLRTVPGFETMLPLRYRTAARTCEHCSQDRRRNDTYVLQSETGEWKQVGRNCLADFLRSTNAGAMAEYAEMLADLDEVVGEFEDDMGEGGGGRAEYFAISRLLGQVACCVRVGGWCSRTEAKNSFEPKTATVDEALSLFSNKVWDRLSAADKIKLTPTDADDARAAGAIAWAHDLPVDVTNDYLWNIRVIAQREYIGYREAGLAGSIISAYNRHLEQEAARKYDRDHPSEYFGTVGEREVFTFTVLSKREMASDYGVTTLVMFRDAAGNRAKWFASGSPEMGVGAEYTVKATIKAHEEYKGSKQTVLSRVAVYDAEAEARQKAAAKVIKKVLKAFKCDHNGNHMQFEVTALAEYGPGGVWMQPCCCECFDAWTARADVAVAA